MQEIVLLVLCRNVIFLSVFFLSINIFAQSYPDNKVDSLIRNGITCIINQEYSSAESLFIKLDKDYPSLPFGNIYIAALNISKSFDYNIEYNDSLISNLLDQAESAADDLISNNPDNIWYLYSKALAEGYYAYYKAINESWFSAVSTGFDAIKDFEKCLSMNPNFNEAMIAIGTYKYWKSKQAEWIPFIEDERKEGIQLLLKAINNSSYNKYLGINSLIWIYIDEKDFDSAQKLAVKSLEEYPNSRFFKWDLARVYEETDKKKAINTYFEILNSYQKSNTLNVYNSILLRHLIAQLYFRLNEKEKSLNMCDEILSLELTKKERNDLENRLERVKQLKKELSGEK